MFETEKEVRPWGAFGVYDQQTGCKIKWLRVDPGQRTSMQVHRWRSETWVVLFGSGRVDIDHERHHAEAGSVFTVPAGAPHRITAYANGPLHLVEVQLGSRTDEDDIVRLADDYGRQVPPQGV